MAASSPSRHLSGKYKDFFDDAAHQTVEHWYKLQASPDLRNKMKTLVNKVLAFDFEAAKATLRTTYEPAIVKANAIFEKNNGRTIISSQTIDGAATRAGRSVTYQEQTVQWLAFASVSDQNLFRETIGMMIPPSRFSSHRHIEEFDPKKKYWKNESQITDHKSLVCGDLLHKPSYIHEIECEVIGKHVTQTGTQFSWKTATSKESVEKRLGGEFKTVSQRAHDSTYQGAPWGVYGDANANKSQWVSQTREDFSETFFIQDKSKRRFQNYNDNYIGLLSKHYTDLQREEKSEKKRKSGTAATASSSVASYALGPTPSPSVVGNNNTSATLLQHADRSTNKLSAVSATLQSLPQIRKR